MAVIEDKYIKGVIGNYTFRKVGKRQVLQAKSNLTKERMTTASLKTASDFGVASNFACWIRDAFDPIINNYYDRSMVYSFTAVMNNTLRHSKDKETGSYVFTPASFNRLDHFEFNKNSPLENIIFFDPEIELNENTLELRIPEIEVYQDLKFQPEASYCFLAFQVAEFDLQNGRFNNKHNKTFEIPNKAITTPAQHWTIEIEPGCLCVIAMSVQYFRKNGSLIILMNNKKLNPCAILKAEMAPGNPDPEKTKKWLKMDFHI